MSRGLRPAARVRRPQGHPGRGPLSAGRRRCHRSTVDRSDSPRTGAGRGPAARPRAAAAHRPGGRPRDGDLQGTDGRAAAGRCPDQDHPRWPGPRHPITGSGTARGARRRGAGPARRGRVLQRDTKGSSTSSPCTGHTRRTAGSITSWWSTCTTPSCSTTPRPPSPAAVALLARAVGLERHLFPAPTG